MATVIHASNFSRKPKGAFRHSVEHKISNGLIRNGHAVMNFSDRETARAGTLFGHRIFGAGAANRAFVEFCRNVSPDLIVLGHANTIRAQSLRTIRAALPNVRVIQYNVDWLLDPKNVDHIRSKLEVVDATLVTTAGEAARCVHRPGAILGFLPNPVDFSIESGRNHERRDLPYDLFFACGNENDLRFTCGRDWSPIALIDVMRSGAPGLRVLSPGMHGEPHRLGGEYQQALESAAIGLNLSRRNDILLYSSDRIAHLAGNGLAVLIDRATGYEPYIAEGEFLYFSTTDELVEKLRRLVGDPDYRQGVAAAGRARFHALFNEQAVAKYLFDVAFGTFDPKSVSWPTLFDF